MLTTFINISLEPGQKVILQPESLQGFEEILLKLGERRSSRIAYALSAHILLELGHLLFLLLDACPDAFHIHCFVPPQRWSSHVEGAPPHPWIDQSFYKSMVLLNNIIEVLDWSEFGGSGKGFFCF